MSVHGNDLDLHYRVLVLGESGVGKTSLIKMLSTQEPCSPGAEVEDFLKAQVCYATVGDYSVTIQLWDGSEGVKEVQTKSRRFPKNTDALLLLFALDSESSAEELEGFHTEGMKSSRQASVLVLGNKADLRKERAFSVKDGQRLTSNLGLEPSAYHEICCTDVARGEHFVDVLARHIMRSHGIDIPSSKKSKCAIM